MDALIRDDLPRPRHVTVGATRARKRGRRRGLWCAGLTVTVVILSARDFPALTSNRYCRDRRLSPGAGSHLLQEYGVCLHLLSGRPPAAQPGDCVRPSLPHTYRITLRFTWRCSVERFLGVEDARGSLGRLVEEVAGGSDVIALTKRGKALAMLVSREEYVQMKLAATERARMELSEALGSARDAVREAGLDAGVVDEAIAAARRL